MNQSKPRTCGYYVDGLVCGKPAADHAFLKGTTLRMFLCADHSDMREEFETMDMYIGALPDEFKLDD